MRISIFVFIAKCFSLFLLLCTFSTRAINTLKIWIQHDYICYALFGLNIIQALNLVKIIQQIKRQKIGSFSSTSCVDADCCCWCCVLFFSGRGLYETQSHEKQCEHVLSHETARLSGKFPGISIAQTNEMCVCVRTRMERVSPNLNNMPSHLFEC